MAAVSAVKPAVKAVVYRNTGTDGTPTWTAQTIIRDVNVSKPWDFGEASTRASRAKLYHPTQMDIQVSITARCDDADAGYVAMDNAACSAATLDMLILDGPIATEGSRGVRAYFHLSDTGQDQSIGNVLYRTYELKPGFNTNRLPQYVVMGASSAITATDPGS